MNRVLGIDDLGQKLWVWVNLVPKLKCVSIFMNCNTQDILKFLLIT